jgi:hypothetical protein
MISMIRLAAEIAVVVLICPMVIVLAFLVMSNDVPRVGETGVRRDGAISTTRLVLVVVLVASLITAVIHFLM